MERAEKECGLCRLGVWLYQKALHVKGVNPTVFPSKLSGNGNNNYILAQEAKEL